MGHSASKAREAHTQLKSQPKNNKKVQQQKMTLAKSTGTLALPDSKLKKLPAELFQLTNLRILDISNNRLTEISDQVSELKKLKTLKLASNELQSLPDLSQLTNLSTLVLDGNPLGDIPKALPPNLVKLSLRNTKLKNIPSTVFELKLLEVLDLGENELTCIPDTIRDLESLTTLTLDNNQLTQLISSLALCQKLTAIYVRNNCIHPKVPGREDQAIAEQILRHSNVQIMQLEGNILSKLDLEAMSGVEQFLERRKGLKSKELHGGLNTDLSICGLE